MSNGFGIREKRQVNDNITSLALTLNKAFIEIAGSEDNVKLFESYCDSINMRIKEMEDENHPEILLNKNDLVGYATIMCVKDMYENIVKYKEIADASYYVSDIASRTGDYVSKIIDPLDFTKKIEMDVLGYRKEYRVYDANFVSDVDEIEGPVEDEAYILALKESKSGECFEIESSSSDDVSYSGWCLSTVASCSIKHVDRLNYTAKPKKKISIKLPESINNIYLTHSAINQEIDLLEDNDGIFEIKDVIEVSADGGDCYYPEGYVRFNEDAFEKPNIRQLNQRPVWIFMGASGAGKSYLSDIICSNNGNMEKFETDSVDELPETICANVIVVGNRREFKIDDIKSRIPLNYTPMLVDFTKQDDVIQESEEE